MCSATLFTTFAAAPQTSVVCHWLQLIQKNKNKSDLNVLWTRLISHSWPSPISFNPSSLQIKTFRLLLSLSRRGASWERARVRSGMKSTRRRGKPSRRGTRRRRAEARGAAVPSAACRRGTAWWARSAAGRCRSPASSPSAEPASACGCVRKSFLAWMILCNV